MSAINELANSIKKFKDYQKNNEDEKIFSYLLKTINNGYGKILEYDIEITEKRLDIIEWCKKNKFYQQSMTLCTEWIPEIIVDKGIYYTKDEEIINNCTKSSKKKLRNWKQEFVVEYPTGQDKISNVEQPIHKQELSEAVNRFARGSDVKLCLFGVKKINTNEINMLLNSFEDELCELKNTNVNKIESKAETSIAGRVIYNIWKRKLNDNYHTTFKQFVSKINAEVLKDIVCWSDDDLKAILGITIDTRDDVSDEITNKIKNRIKYHRKVLSDKTNPIKSNYDIEIVISILEKYNWIRQYRNQINHANNNFVIKINELDDNISDLVSAIKTIR